MCLGFISTVIFQAEVSVGVAFSIRMPLFTRPLKELFICNKKFESFRSILNRKKKEKRLEES